MGSCTNGHGRCNGGDFKAGPMAVIVDKITRDALGYSLADSGALEFLSEPARCGLVKGLPKTFVVGKRREFETAHFFKEARALARLAKEEAVNDRTPRGVVLFRDADGTRSTERGLYEAKVKSICDGFMSEDFDFGVPMIPKPKSEAWLICALKSDAYQNCGVLEAELSGNDNAPEPAKARLEALLSEKGHEVGDLADLVNSGEIDALHEGMKEMDSFDAFDRRLREVLRSMQSQRF